MMKAGENIGIDETGVFGGNKECMGCNMAVRFLLPNAYAGVSAGEGCLREGCFAPLLSAAFMEVLMPHVMQGECDRTRGHQKDVSRTFLLYGRAAFVRMRNTL